MAVIAILCLGAAIFILPSPFPNLLYCSESYSRSPLSLPTQPLMFIYTVSLHPGERATVHVPFDVSVTLSLPNGGKYMVVNPIHMAVTLNLPTELHQPFAPLVSFVEVVAEGAVVFGLPPLNNFPSYWGEFPSSTEATAILPNETSYFSTNYPIFSLSLNRNSTLQSKLRQFEVWQAEENIQYTTAGEFGLAINLFRMYVSPYNVTGWIGYTIHTPPFIPIISADVIKTENNNSLTISLTFVILMFAAIDVRADTKPEKTYYEQEDA